MVSPEQRDWADATQFTSTVFAGRAGSAGSRNPTVLRGNALSSTLRAGLTSTIGSVSDCRGPSCDAGASPAARSHGGPWEREPIAHPTTPPPHHLTTSPP